MRVALVFICLNEPYWPYVGQVIDDCKQKFLPKHKVDYFIWSDITREGVQKFMDRNLAPFDTLKKPEELLNHFTGILKELGSYNGGLTTEAVYYLKYKYGIGIAQNPDKTYSYSFEKGVPKKLALALKEAAEHFLEPTFGKLRDLDKKATIFPTESVQWPIPTLMRYHLFLEQEEILKDYDYIFYLDADMRVVDEITEEIMGEGLTMAEHPMYALRREYVPPYEPNKDSAAYIKRFGCLVPDGDKPRFKPLYAAGGFQGGKAKEFIAAMKVMKKNVDRDFNNNYIAIWNDESHWNKYLADLYTGPLTILTPAYVYPDSMISEYYLKVWGTDYPKKIITLTKPFTTSSDGGAAIKERLATM